VIPEIEEIRMLRRQLGLTQTELARMAGVSQSLIAKIERGLVQPSYHNVKRLVESLQGEANRRQPAATVGSTCTKNIVWAEAHETVKDAANLMRKHGFSQVPVRRRGQLVGAISERTLSDLFSTSDQPETLGRKRIEEIMGDPFPQVPETTPIKVASALLQFAPAVMVLRAGEPVGILTKSDLLKVLAK
jgi:predicted transcriptional regulator